MRRHLSFANVVSSMALFTALGGGAYAAVSLPRNSVGEPQIKAGAVRSGEVKDGTLRAKDFKRGDLPRGAAGGTGAAGATGAQGASGPAGPRGPATGFKSGSTDAVTPGLSPAYTTVRSVAVPAGSFVATAAGEVQNLTAIQTVRCKLSLDDADPDIGVLVPTSESMPIAVTGAGVLASPGTIRFECRRFGGADVSVSRATLTVTQVQALNGA